MSRHWLIALLVACGNNAGTTPPDGSGSGSGDGQAATPDASSGGGPALPTLQFCTVANPHNINSALVATPIGDGITYTCAVPCADYTTCAFGMVDGTGAPVLSARGGLQMQLLVFVVDGMAGHFAYTPDGNDVIVTHAGSGGTSVFNAFDKQLQALSSLKTVSLGWVQGTTTIFNGGGWFTRKDGAARTIVDQVGRPAAAIQWVKDHFAVGKKLGTVGSSMGTVATLGAHVWYGLEPILDYQMLIGGPGMWDVNAGCGRIHITAGYCDADASPCTGNPNSSYGDNDPVCPGGVATNNCRVPTIMAPLSAGGSAYNAAINYVHNTTACAPTVGDSRDTSLDASSMASTVTSWSFHGRIDFVTNEGGTQPPNADQGMGEGHMLYIYHQLTGAKGWTDNEGYHHGDSWDLVPALMTASAQIAVNGMTH